MASRLGSRGKLDTSHTHSLLTTTPKSESSARKAGATMGICPQGGRLDLQDQVTETVDTHTHACAHTTLAPSGDWQDAAESCHLLGLLTIKHAVQTSALGSTCVEHSGKHSALSTPFPA